MCTLTPYHLQCTLPSPLWKYLYFESQAKIEMLHLSDTTREIKHGRNLWKCPAPSPAQSRVTSKSNQVAQGLVPPNRVGQLISSNHTLEQWTVFSLVQIQIHCNFHICLCPNCEPAGTVWPQALYNHSLGRGRLDYDLPLGFSRKKKLNWLGVLLPLPLSWALQQSPFKQVPTGTWWLEIPIWLTSS